MSFKYVINTQKLLMWHLTFFFHIKFQMPMYFTFKTTAGLATFHVLSSQVWEWPLLASGALGQEPRFGFTGWVWKNQESCDDSSVMTALSYMPINLELGQRVRSDPWGSAFSTLFLVIFNLKCNHDSPRIYTATCYHLL